ncbi:MAG TPA: glycoside hydrolase family 15 protein [Pirellulales bacterium]|nr:glycoside hydrolase family 15 protein [Pirellulales bacterium]
MPSRIEDYAMIGDVHTAALVARDGSVDWLCLPRFDSGACFAALLGTHEHGRWMICPAGEVRRVERRYRHDTLVLETTFETDDGSVSVVDCMPPRSGYPALVRVVVGQRGRVPMRMQLVLRFDYGSIVPWVQHNDSGLSAVAGPDTVHLQTPVRLRGEGLTSVAEFSVGEGEEVPFVLRWHPSHEEPPPDVDAREAVRFTEEWWTEWAGRCRYTGRWRDNVVRSLITLKGLTYEPTGGMVAAATASLPEWIGGERNWDYRYCWLRDATFMLYSLLDAGYHGEAQAWRDWLLRAVAGKASQLNIMYGVTGERRLTEIELGWLPGYEESRPVRIGNAAHDQFQLDVYGEVMDVVHVARRHGMPIAKHAWDLQRSLLEYLEQVWHEPDEGIWEVRGGRRHFTHSRVMAWLGVDRMIKSAEHFHLPGDVKHWRKLRQQIHDETCAKGFNEAKNSFVQFYGSKNLDASLLMIPLVGFLPAHDPRVQGTITAIEKELLVDGLVLRYLPDKSVDGLHHKEGVFLPCSFWLVDNYHLQDRDRDADELYERLLGLCNDVGLISEEYDVERKRMLGNFPQAFTHVGIVNTAKNLSSSHGPARHRPNHVTS